MRSKPNCSGKPMTHMPDSSFFFAPGFLGEGDDGIFLKKLGAHYIGLDFFSPTGLLSQGLKTETGFTQLAEKIFQQIVAKDASNKINLVGYSLGGRVLAHVFLKEPESFHRLYLISSHLGLPSEEERIARKAMDAVWAEKFLTMNWTDVMQEWNGQSVFAGGGVPDRKENSFHRHSLSLAFTALSLGAQENLEARLLPYQDRIVYVYGEKDSKFVDLAQRYANQGFETQMIRQSGHRVIFDQPDQILELIQKSSPSM